MKIKCFIGIGYPTATHEVEWELDELGLDQQQWESMSDDEKQEFLDMTLDSELNNILETSIWVEE